MDIFVHCITQDAEWDIFKWQIFGTENHLHLTDEFV